MDMLEVSFTRTTVSNAQAKHETLGTRDHQVARAS